MTDRVDCDRVRRGLERERIRVGMEDTVWLWPHRDDRVRSNLQFLELAKALAGVLGRDVATHEEYRRMVGMDLPVDAAAG